MFEKLVVGAKIEIQYKDSIMKSTDQDRSYASQIIDFKDDELIVCNMPFYEGKLVPLEVGAVIETFFYIGSNTYRCDCSIEERGKEGNIYVMSMRPITEIEKFQRRAFFRLDCQMEVSLRPLSNEEMDFFEKREALPERLTGLVEKGVIVDISGGGMRVLARKRFEKDTYINVLFAVKVNGQDKVFNVIGKIIASFTSQAKSDVFDNRIQFYKTKKEDVNIIVKYIFEQQRMQRKKERG